MNQKNIQRRLKAEAENLENARYLNRADVVIMTESTEDEPFWKAVFLHAMPKTRIMFNYAVQSRQSSSYGKTVCMKYRDFTTPHFVLAIDSDFDRILDEKFPYANYIFHTQTYSWENHYCWIPSLDDWYRSKAEGEDFSFDTFLTNLSRIL